MIGDPTYSRRKVRELLTGLVRLAHGRGARRILLTSVEQGAGKTRLTASLKHEARSLPGASIAFVSRAYLDRVQPADLGDHDLVLVDGPAVIDVDGLHDIPEVWRRGLDGAVLVVIKRRTRRVAVEEARRWLEANGIALLGVVWNEYTLPPVFVQLARVRAWIGRMFAGSKERS